MNDSRQCTDVLSLHHTFRSVSRRECLEGQTTLSVYSHRFSVFVYSRTVVLSPNLPLFVPCPVHPLTEGTPPALRRRPPRPTRVKTCYSPSLGPCPSPLPSWVYPPRVHVSRGPHHPSGHKPFLRPQPPSGPASGRTSGSGTRLPTPVPPSQSRPLPARCRRETLRNTRSFLLTLLRSKTRTDLGRRSSSHSQPHSPKSPTDLTQSYPGPVGEGSLGVQKGLGRRSVHPEPYDLFADGWTRFRPPGDVVPEVGEGVGKERTGTGRGGADPGVAGVVRGK